MSRWPEAPASPQPGRCRALTAQLPPVPTGILFYVFTREIIYRRCEAQSRREGFLGQPERGRSGGEPGGGEGFLRLGSRPRRSRGPCTPPAPACCGRFRVCLCLTFLGQTSGNPAERTWSRNIGAGKGDRDSHTLPRTAGPRTGLSGPGPDPRLPGPASQARVPLRSAAPQADCPPRRPGTAGTGRGPRVWPSWWGRGSWPHRRLPPGSSQCAPLLTWATWSSIRQVTGGFGQPGWCPWAPGSRAGGRLRGGRWTLVCHRP